MKLVLVLAMLTSSLLVPAPCGFPREGRSAETQLAGAVLVKLILPSYPRRAQRAHISGDVRIDLRIRPDGSVESAVAAMGHPWLTQAALESVQGSRFECLECRETTAYSLTYSFTIRDQCADSPDCSIAGERPPEIRQEQSHIVVTVDPLCTCDPTASITTLKWRAAKCLYLWHCKSRVIDIR